MSKIIERPPRLLLSGRQGAIVLLHVFALRDQKRRKPMTRANLSAPTLRRLWGRPQLKEEFLQDVTEWMLVAGWAFFNAGSTYAAVRISAVANWPSVASKSVKSELGAIAAGQLPSGADENLLWQDFSASAENESSPDRTTSLSDEDRDED